VLLKVRGIMAKRRHPGGIPDDLDEVVDNIWFYGPHLRYLRLIHGLTQTTLAARARVPVSAIAAIEREAKGARRLSVILRVAVHLRIDPRRLDDEEYIEPLVDRKKDDRKKYGKLRRRDKRCGWPDDFWEWFHQYVVPRHPRGALNGLKCADLKHHKDEYDAIDSRKRGKRPGNW
jgi:transcriptional regulator with XRE-family HTH domain